MIYGFAPLGAFQDTDQSIHEQVADGVLFKITIQRTVQFACNQVVINVYSRQWHDLPIDHSTQASVAINSSSLTPVSSATSAIIYLASRYFFGSSDVK